MNTIILRRRGLGNGSVRGIVAASRTGINWVRNDQPFPDNVTTVIRWGCTSTIPQVSRVLNGSQFIHRVNHKLMFRQIMQGQSGGKICPTTWYDSADVQYPAIIRPAEHAQGKHLHLVNDAVELRRVIYSRPFSDIGWYASEYIEKVAEYRVCFVEGRVCWVAKKTPADPSAIAWNVAQGGRFDNVRWSDWPINVLQTAHQSFLLSGLDFGGVDVMVDAVGDVFVLEINSAPSQTSPYRQSCMAKCFDWISNGLETSPIYPTTTDNWKKYAHLAIIQEE